ncbi:putative mitochondrial protein [Andalucia godoyi]|uniref:Putative mitochondrial protein n=1 Tax=Andalucia godoyi TaxID=505711 RepID=A0A8K0AIQ6_ANDGO|nr:putative mitochondrial protein [Andalucia godoyi]|eukprot:ANDGO_02318.mRNA.1 putative mitochondrial protein
MIRAPSASTERSQSASVNHRISASRTSRPTTANRSVSRSRPTTARSTADSNAFMRPFSAKSIAHSTISFGSSSPSRPFSALGKIDTHALESAHHIGDFVRLIHPFPALTGTQILPSATMSPIANLHVSPRVVRMANLECFGQITDIRDEFESNSNTRGRNSSIAVMPRSGSFGLTAKSGGPNRSASPGSKTKVEKNEVILCVRIWKAGEEYLLDRPLVERRIGKLRLRAGADSLHSSYIQNPYYRQDLSEDSVITVPAPVFHKQVRREWERKLALKGSTTSITSTEEALQSSVNSIISLSMKKKKKRRDGSNPSSNLVSPRPTSPTMVRPTALSKLMNDSFGSVDRAIALRLREMNRNMRTDVLAVYGPRMGSVIEETAVVTRVFAGNFFELETPYGAVLAKLFGIETPRVCAFHLLLKRFRESKLDDPALLVSADSKILTVGSSFRRTNSRSRDDGDDAKSAPSPSSGRRQASTASKSLFNRLRPSLAAVTAFARMLAKHRAKQLEINAWSARDFLAHLIEGQEILYRIRLLHSSYISVDVHVGYDWAQSALLKNGVGWVDKAEVKLSKECSPEFIPQGKISAMDKSRLAQLETLEQVAKDGECGVWSGASVRMAYFQPRKPAEVRRESTTVAAVDSPSDAVASAAPKASKWRPAIITTRFLIRQNEAAKPNEEKQKSKNVASLVPPLPNAAGIKNVYDLIMELRALSSVTEATSPPRTRISTSRSRSSGRTESFDRGAAGIPNPSTSPTATVPTGAAPSTSSSSSSSSSYPPPSSRQPLTNGRPQADGSHPAAHGDEDEDDGYVQEHLPVSANMLFPDDEVDDKPSKISMVYQRSQHLRKPTFGLSAPFDSPVSPSASKAPSPTNYEDFHQHRKSFSPGLNVDSSSG